MRRENLSTYVVQDKKNKQDELTRLTVQDQMITAAMGGVLPEQADPTVFHDVLDVACGTGGWLIEMARTYPGMSLVGIDISQQMIKYARMRAEANQVSERIEFYVMDALEALEFPAASFDLVNLRFGLSFLRTWDWSRMLGGLLRVTCPGGVVRITENDLLPQKSNSPALTRLFKELHYAYFRAGHLFEKESPGVVDHLPQLFDRYGGRLVQTKAYVMEYRAGTAEGEALYENVKLLFQTQQPFIQKWGDAPHDYRAIYRRALDEIRQPDFCATWNLLTVWGSRP